MIQPRKSQQASRGGQADKAAHKKIAEAREAIAETQEGLDDVREFAFAVAAAEAAAAEQESASEGKRDPVSEIIEKEIHALGKDLSPRQRVVLADLTRLHFSRRGPQDLLETAGNFSRPVYPPILHRRRGY
jgi:hypothetical protein